MKLFHILIIALVGLALGHLDGKQKQGNLRRLLNDEEASIVLGTSSTDRRLQSMSPYLYIKNNTPFFASLVITRPRCSSPAYANLHPGELGERWRGNCKTSSMCATITTLDGDVDCQCFTYPHFLGTGATHFAINYSLGSNSCQVVQG